MIKFFQKYFVPPLSCISFDICGIICSIVRQSYTWGVNSNPQQTWGWIRAMEAADCPHEVKHWRVWSKFNKKWIRDPSLTVVCSKNLWWQFVMKIRIYLNDFIHAINICNYSTTHITYCQLHCTRCPKKCPLVSCSPFLLMDIFFGNPVYKNHNI